MAFHAHGGGGVVKKKHARKKVSRVREGETLSFALVNQGVQFKLRALNAKGRQATLNKGHSLKQRVRRSLDNLD